MDKHPCLCSSTCLLLPPPLPPLLLLLLGYEVSRLVEALCYKLGGRGFDSLWGFEAFYWINPSGLTMAMELTQPLTDMNIKELPCGGTGRGRVKTTGSCSWQPYHFHVPIVWKFWDHQPSGAVRTCPGLYRESFTFTFTTAATAVVV
jgi:hypothetical protein